MTQQKMMILHFIDSGGLYGAESVLLNLSELMASSGRYEPVVGCIVPSAETQSDLYDKALELGLRAEKIVIRNTMLLVDLPRAARQLKKMGVHLIHSHGYKPSVFGYVVKKLTRIEVMSTCHLWFKGSKGPLKMRVMVALELFFYKSFKRVIGVSEPIKDVLVASGVPEPRVQVIQNGVKVGDELLVSNETLATLRQELRLTENDFCILNTGRLTKQKAQWDIISAAGFLRDQGIMARFFIVGEGELKEQLQSQIKAAKLENSVEILGFRDDITELLQIADLFVLPSLDEGMPMSLLEAAAVGLPIVATEVGDIPKLIVDQVSGSVVPAGEPEILAQAIAAQIEDPNTGTNLAAAARKRVEQTYSTKAMFAQYDQVYQALK